MTGFIHEYMFAMAVHRLGPYGLDELGFVFPMKPVNCLFLIHKGRRLIRHSIYILRWYVMCSTLHDQGISNRIWSHFTLTEYFIGLLHVKLKLFIFGLNDDECDACLCTKVMTGNGIWMGVWLLISSVVVTAKSCSKPFPFRVCSCAISQTLSILPSGI